MYGPAHSPSIFVLPLSPCVYIRVHSFFELQSPSVFVSFFSSFCSSTPSSSNQCVFFVFPGLVFESSSINYGKTVVVMKSDGSSVT